MRVLVIGGTRFVGYQLVWRLLAGGHAVTILNRGLHPDPFGERVERLIADRTTSEFERELTGKSFDSTVDFAAYTAGDVQQALSVLGRGRAGHYVFISTGQVYLVLDSCHSPAREEDYYGTLLPEPAEPSSRDEWSYGVQKRQAEDVLTEAWAASGFPATRLRLPMVNGERDPYHRIESYLWRILDGGPVLLPDGGAQPIRHVYSGEVVRVITSILGNGATFGEAYNLTQDRMPTLAELVSLLANLLGSPARPLPVSSDQLREAGLEPTEISPFSTRWMSCLDGSRARVELGFRHEPLRTYLEKIVTCFINHPPELPENYRHRNAELALAARFEGQPLPSPFDE